MERSQFEMNPCSWGGIAAIIGSEAEPQAGFRVDGLSGSAPAQPRDIHRVRENVLQGRRAGKHWISLPQTVAVEEIIGPSAGLLDNQEAGERVPGVDVQFAIGIDASVSHIGKANIVADFPLCNKSFNCSYSGHDL